MFGEIESNLVSIALELIAKSAIVIALVALCVAALRKASATTRHALWLSAIALLIVMPIAAIALPSVSIPVLPAREAPIATSAAVEPPIVIETPGAIAVADEPAAAQPVGPTDAPAEAKGLSLNTWLFLVWLIGVSLIALRAVVGMIGVVRLQRHAEPVDDEAWIDTLAEVRREMGIERDVALLRSPRVAVPMTWGVVRPRICLPMDSHDWSVSKRRIVISHELAHVRRGDWLWQLIATAATALHWFNPLAWWAARRMRSEAETACDDSVIAHGCRPVDYADCLYELVRDSRAPRPAFTAAVAMARRTQLPERLTMILNDNARRSPMRFRTLAIVLTGAMLAGTIVATAQLDHATAAVPAAPAEREAPKAIEKNGDALITDAHRAAIDKGTNYLLKRQADDGGIGEAGGKSARMRPGISALAVLAWLGHDGPDPNGRVKKAIEAGAAYLADTQDREGQLGGRKQIGGTMYSHGFALLALVKTYERTRDVKLKAIIQNAVKFTVDSQNKMDAEDTIGGWRYRAGSKDADTSIVSCQLVALAAAEAVRFRVPQLTYDKALKYLLTCQNEDGGFSYTQNGPTSRASLSAASVAALIASRADAKTTAKGAGYVVASLGHEIKMHRDYAEYYRSLVLGTMQAKQLSQWYVPTSAQLLKSQKPDGSWAIGTPPDIATPFVLIALQSPNKRLRLSPRPRIGGLANAALPAKFVGTWEPLSRNHIAILGEMRIAGDRIDFERKGKSTFRIVRAGENEVVVKLGDDLEGSGPFMRLGPIERDGDDEQIEVAFYETDAKALAKRTDRIGGASSWGVYLRAVDEAR